MSKRKKKNKHKKPLEIQEKVVVLRESLAGFPLILHNTNALWRWDTLETVKF